jgi:hypothetical protein
MTAPHRKCPTLLRRLAVTRRLAAIVGLLCLGCGGTALAQTERQVYVPVTFNAEGTGIRTTACLEVTERVEPQMAWWEDAAASANPAERAFKAVIAAIKRKDSAALAKLADPAQGEGTKDFDDQSVAFFQQFDALKIVAVPRAYAFDGLLVFFPKLEAGSQSFFAPFVFAHKEDGSFRFLPARSKQPGLQIVADWFTPNLGSPEASEPPYCDDKDIKRATHRVPLAPVDAGKVAWHPSQLFFAGASFEAPETLGDLAARVLSKIESVRSADFSAGADDFLKLVTPEGGEQIKKWLATVTDAERAKYKRSLVQQMEHPVFLIDASPLVAVYTRPSGGVQVVYFTVGGNDDLLWTNIARITDSDKLFKRGVLRDAAVADKPFSRFAIK